MQRAVDLNEIKLNFFVIFTLSSISYPRLKLLAVIVFEVSKFEKGNDKKKKTFFKKFSPDNLLIILFRLTKFEAPSCDSF